jgi:anti-sigma-K factor RskA
LKHERATEEIRELAALYALGSLTQHEARSFETHMSEGCSICEAEFHRFEHIVAVMGFAADETAAPDYVRDLLLARIERENKPMAQTVESKPQKLKIPIPPPPGPLLLSQPLQRKTNPFAWTLVLLLVVVTISMFIFWKSGQNTIHGLKETIASNLQDMKDKDDFLAVQRAILSEREQIYSMAGKPGSRILQLSGPPSAPAALGAVLWDGAEGKFLAFGVLPSAPQGKIFQFWFHSSTLKIPAGLIKQDPTNGQFFITGTIPREAVNATLVAISLEPDNGSQIPSIFYAVARIN